MKMGSMRRWLVVLAVGWGVVGGGWAFGQSTAPASSGGISWDDYEPIEAVKDKLEIGLRYSYIQLKEDTKGDPDGDNNYFLGSINELEEAQSTRLLPYARYLFTPYFGVELSYDKMRMITRKANASSEDTDGSIKISGPALAVLGQYPNASRFTPYGEVGILFAKGGFDHADWWHNGFPEYGQAFFDWQAMGEPPWPNNGYRRNISISDETATFLAGGCSVRLADHWSLDVQARYLMLDVDAHYTLSFHGTVRDDRGFYTFPLDSWTYQLGLKYTF